MKLLIAFTFALHVCFGLTDGKGFYVDNFEKQNDSSWIEVSDTLMPQGKSKATLDTFESGQSKRAILFTLLDPQDGGAAFAGIRKSVSLDLSERQSIYLKLKAHGQYKGYEFCMRHQGVSGVTIPAFCHYFTAPSDYDVVELPLDKFKPYFEGKIVPNYAPLDTTNITQLNLLAYGGAFLPKELQQTGVAALEIKWIYIE